MGRSIDEFVRRTRTEEAYKKKKERTQFRNTMSGVRGLDAFYEMKQNYFQEADDALEEFDQAMDEFDNGSETEELSDDNDDANSDEDIDTGEEDNDMTDDVSNTDNASSEPDMNDEDMGNMDDDMTDDVSSETPNTTPSSNGGSPLDDEDENMRTFGQHGGDDLPNNQYDPAEIAKVMEFVADEAKSLSAYMEAVKTSKVDILQRLYSDIADEERYHMEQLLFAKAEITGEEYKPHDPDIRKEYEELLAMGMDEGSAMATAVDKFNLHVTTITPADDKKLDTAMEDINDAVQEMDRAFLYIDTIEMIMEYCTDDYILDKVIEINSPQFYQEDVNVISTANGAYNKSMNPLQLIMGLFVGIHKLFMKITHGIRLLLEKNFNRIRKLGKFVKNHNISELFQAGVRLYLWNDDTSTFEIDPIIYYTNCTLWMCQEVARLAKTNGEFTNKILSIRQVFDLSGVQKSQFKTRPPVSTCYQYLTSLDPIKTKVVVTQRNAAMIDNEFFQNLDTDDDYARNYRGQNNINLDINGIRVSPPLQNAFNKLDLMIHIITSFSELVQYFNGELVNLESDNASIFHRNRKVYDLCVEYMKAVSKGLNKLSKICASDLKELENLMTYVQNV